MSFRRWKTSGVPLCLSLCLFAAPGAAQLPEASVTGESHETASKSQELELFAQAIKLFKQDNYAQALPLFRALASVTDSPNAHLYVGYCLQRRGRAADAYQAYSRVLGAITPRTNDRYRATGESARAQLASLESQVGRVLLSLPEAATELSVALDGQGLSPQLLAAPIGVEPGHHSLESSANGASVTLEFDVRAGESKTLAIPVALSPAPRVEAPAMTSNDPHRALRTWGFVAGGAGVLGVSLFALAGLEAKRVHDRLQDECAGGCTDGAHRDDVAHGKAMQTLANGGLALGVAGIAASSVLLVLGASSNAQASASLGLVPGGATLGYRSRF